MKEATLTIEGTDRALRFVLHLTEASQPTVLQTSTSLDPFQRQNISRAFEEFATCQKGLPAHEPEFCQLGQLLFRLLLPPPIQVQLQSLDGPLTILTNDPTLPWEILHDGREYLALRLPVARQLIIREQFGSVLRSPATCAKGFSALVIADPTEDLPGAAEEGKALFEFFRSKGLCHLLLGSEATWENIHRHLMAAPYSVVHFCGHIDYNPDERLSSIRLGGGKRFSSHEAPKTLTGSPIVFLNGCYSDLPLGAEAACSRTESFAQAFMVGNDGGVATAVVGTMWRIPDEPRNAGRDFSLTFYRSLFDGRTIADAMRLSRVAARQNGMGPMVWGPYVLYGSASLKPFVPEAAREPVTESRQPFGQAVRQNVLSADDTFAGRTADFSPGPSSPFRQQFEGAEPLDTAGREVIHVALREMQQMRQGALSSVHFLIGLCAAGVGALTQVLSKRGVDAARLCDEARERARTLLPGEEAGFGVSANVILALAYAAKRAKSLRKEKIGADDLLAGLAKCETSEAMRILKQFGVSASDILELLGESVSFSNWSLADGVREALEHAIQCAEEMNLNFLGTPHLLIGLVRTGSVRTIALLRARGVGIERLCRTLMQGMGYGSPTHKRSESPHPTDRCLRVLRRAKQLADQESSARVGELHLLRAILEEKDGLTSQALRLQGTDPTRLLAELGDVGALARGLVHVLGMRATELAAAFHRIEEQGNESTRRSPS